MQKPNAIEVSGLTKKFSTLTAVNEVSFTVTQGEFFGFLGPNGAGKTTLIRMLTTLIKPTGGRAVVSCCDITNEPQKIREKIGVVPQASTSDLDLTGYENMDIYGRFYNIPKKERTEKVKYLLEIVGLTSRANDLVVTYSGGMRRRLEIARALIHTPEILFLDEPTIGLDPQSRRVVWEFLEKFREKDSLTIFISTHYMEEAESLCDRVAIIDAGKIIAIDSPENLKSQIPGSDIIFLTIADSSLSGTVQDILKGVPFVHNVKTDADTLRIYVDNGTQNLPLLMDKVREAGVTINSVSIHQQSLEDVFIHHTGKSIREEEAKKVSFFIGAGVPQKLGR
ncbi:MAG: ATP-binding cassette domain-containing protein [Candidatus Levybacteria bacterium]|nr:ATP-binding cassette domain-containing protein [Candidatus Levybacteria bacterium]